MEAFIKAYGPSVPWVIAAVGWLISNYQANRREKRKEFRSEIDSLEKLIKTVVDKLSIYYRTTGGDETRPIAELEIKLLLKEIDFKWERLSKRNFRGTCASLRVQCGKSNEAFYDYSTGQYFESTDIIEARDIPARIQKLNICALTLIEDLHSLFLCEFDGVGAWKSSPSD